MKILLTLLLCGLPFSHFVFNKIDIWRANGMWFQIGLLVCFCASFYFKPKETKVKNIPLGVLTLWLGFVTCFYTYQLLKMRQQNMMLFLPFFNFICMVIYYRLVVQYLNKEWIRKTLQFLACGLIITLFYSTVQAFGLDQFYNKIDYHAFDGFPGEAVVGFIGNGTHLSAYIACLLPTLFLLPAGIAWTSIGLLFVIILFHLGFGNPSIPVTGVVIAVIVLGYYLYHCHKILFGCLVVICIIVGIMCAFYMGEKDLSELVSTTGRMRVWDKAGELMKKTFVTGKGLGMVQAIFTKLGGRESIYRRYRHLHNEYLHFTFETGIIGLMAIFYCIYGFFRINVRKCKELVIARAVMIGFLLQSLTLYPCHLWAMSSVMMFSYASIYALKNEEVQN